MAEYFHVNGAAQVKVGLGASGALALLGHSVDGVHIWLSNADVPVYTDAAPAEAGIEATSQAFGQRAIIQADMVVYDETVMVGVRAGSEKSVEGQMIAGGTILDAVPPGGGAGNKGYYRVLVLSPGDGVPWNFLTCRLVEAPFRLSSRPTIYRITWRAVPLIGASSTLSGAVLYNRVTT